MLMLCVGARAGNVENTRKSPRSRRSVDLQRRTLMRAVHRIHFPGKSRAGANAGSVLRRGAGVADRD